MAYKVFEQNGIETENIDGAGFNNFTAGNRNGIIKGILNECQIYQPSSNSIAINTGEIVVKGVRIKIIDAETQSFTSLPAIAEKWHIVAQVTMPSDRQLTASILFRQQTQLIQEDLLKNEQGTYEEIIAEFTLSTDGVTNIIKKMQVIVGGNNSNGNSNIDLSEYQKKVDEDLKTESKEIVGAINEINEKAGQGGSGLTEEEKAKVDKLVIDGTGDKFLADNGEYKEIEGGSNLDVQINGTSIVENGVANIPYGGNTPITAGVFWVTYVGRGLQNLSNGELRVYGSSKELIAARKTLGDTINKPICLDQLDYAVMASLTNPQTHTWTEDEKSLAQQTLGISGGGGTQLHRHKIEAYTSSATVWIDAISTSNTQFNSLEDLMNTVGEQGLMLTTSLVATPSSGGTPTGYYNFSNTNFAGLYPCIEYDPTGNLKFSSIRVSDYVFLGINTYDIIAL